jgi:hypothetical protein
VAVKFFYDQVVFLPARFRVVEVNNIGFPFFQRTCRDSNGSHRLSLPRTVRRQASSVVNERQQVLSQDKLAGSYREMGQGASPDQARNGRSVNPQKAGDFLDGQKLRCIGHGVVLVGTERKASYRRGVPVSTSPSVEVARQNSANSPV